MTDAAPIRFWFDFSSPYAWLAWDAVHDIARAAGRPLVLRPMLTWAVLRDQGIAAPVEVPARLRYLLQDIPRSAAFLGVTPFVLPDPLPISAHLATRLWLGVAREQPDCARDLARAIYQARFANGADIRRIEVLQQAAAQLDLSAEFVTHHAEAAINREALTAANAEAVAAGVCGAPFVEIDGEGFFGADRLPQIRWRLGLPPA